jgi:hypothetical protein
MLQQNYPPLFLAYNSHFKILKYIMKQNIQNSSSVQPIYFYV